MNPHYTHDPGTGITQVDGQPVVFHCNHYNRVLQYTIQNSVFAPAAEILTRGATDVAYLALKNHFKAHPGMTLAGRLSYASSLYRAGGYGILDLTEALDWVPGGEIRLATASSHYGFALQLNFEPPIEPGEFFDLGYSLGALAAVFDRGFAGEIGYEAISTGATTTVLRIREDESRLAPLTALQPRKSIGGEFPGLTQPAPEKTFAPHIDEPRILQALAGLTLAGDEKTGLIAAFGVNLTRMFADYYNLISYRFETHMQARLAELPSLADLLVYDYPTLFYFQQYFKLEGHDLIQALFIEAGHVCGFNTMGGIMQSDAWKGLVMPMIRRREDWIQGIVSCINALGWGVWRIHELVPDERLILRTWHPYESLGYVRWFGRASHGVDYCMAGVACSIMNLMYEGDITSYPELNEDYYNQVNRSKNSFWVRQTKCVAMGDEYSEIVVTRAPRH